MFYNCPVRKLASHSPPSCEKKKKKKTIHIQTHTLTGTYILTCVDTYRLRHTCRDIQATQAPAGITFSQAGTGRGVEAVLSLSEPVQVCRDLYPRARPRLPASQLWAYCLLLCHGFWLLAIVSALGKHRPQALLLSLCSQQASQHPTVPGESPQSPGV